jgi:hypothetical protein
MIGIHYYTQDFINRFCEAHSRETGNLDELKRLEYHLWYYIMEIIEFSRGNRDFIVHGCNENEELITIGNL